MSKETGGQAFPGKVCIGHTPGDELPIYEHQKGMTLRDYFAIKSLNGMITTAAGPCMGGFDGYEEHMAKAAYKMADAMIAERAK